MRDALSIPTVVSRGAWNTMSARFSPATASASLCAAASSRNSRRMRNFRPASSTSASPRASISARAAWRRPATCEGSAGALMVATATASGIRPAAASTAAPPRLWPTRIAGAARSRPSHAAAATRSSTFDENVVLANSPSDPPSPVKSKRSTAMPASVSASLMKLAALLSLEQVKQCANRA